MKRPTDQLGEWEWIEEYWAGRLSPEEKAFFERIMEEDPRFAEEVASLKDGVKRLNEARMEQHIRHTLRRLQETDRQTKQIRLGWVSWAGVLAAACVGFLLMLSFKPIVLPGYENDWEVIRDLRGDYRADSTDHFSLRRKQAFDLFFEAQALLSEGQPSQAAQRFEQVLNFPNLRPYFRESVQWHLVVCYLKSGQTTKATDVYSQVKNTNVYDIGRLSRWQIGWQIWLSHWFGGGSPEPEPTTQQHQ